MSEKTEQATPKRLKDARKKGQVAKSREIPSVLIILAIVSTLLAMVTVKGLAARAALIIRIAEEENIPVMRQVTLARTLQADTEIGDYIPSELIQPVAEVLKWAEQVNRKNSPT